MSNQYVPDADTLPIPVYRIDLSLPPSERYVTLAQDFAPKMRALTNLFDELVASVTPSNFLQRTIKHLASWFLFRLHSQEETEEARGLARASGIPLYLVIALNVLLDSLLGCTSGAVKTQVKDAEDARMIHFRTLDWGMEPLRDVLVILEFVRSESKRPDEVIASSVTYAGFVGVLTGVRKDLSLSLNFRPYHECTVKALRVHQMAVLLGMRPSVSSILRTIILPEAPASLGEVTKHLETIPTSPCYLILSSGSNAIVLEKDLHSARVMSSDEFIVATNCDCAPPAASEGTTTVNNAIGMDMVLDEADERKETIEKRFRDVRKRQEKKWKEERSEVEFQVKVRESTVLGWLKVYPVWNELTHFGCLMDPTNGTIRWSGRGVLEEKDDDNDKERSGWRGV